MSNFKQQSHELRHDRDDTVSFDRRLIDGIVEFDPAWIQTDSVDEGLPIHVGEWIKSKLQPNHSVVGVRWLKNYPYRFILTRYEHTYVAEFLMPNERFMRVAPGYIEIYRHKPSMELLVRYNEFKTAEGSTWKAWMEVRRYYDYNYHDCPLNLEVCLSLIDNMLYQITRAPNHNVGKELCSEFRLLGKVPFHIRTLFESPKTYQGDFKTPPEIERFYHYLARCFYMPEHFGAQPTIVSPDTLPPEQNYRALFEKLIAVCREGVDTSALQD